MISRRRVLLGLAPVLALCATAWTAEKMLYEKKSAYSTVTVTEDDQGLRTLSFDKNGVRQSVVKPGDPDHVELPYARVMLVALACVEPPKRMLIVGLGGGTIPSLLHKHYPAATIDVVDIDPVVVEVARDYFGFREDATLHAHVDDGRRFIEMSREPYHIIFLDAFSAEEIPYHLATQQFLKAVRRALAPGGVVVANVWSRRSNRLYDSMVRTYRSVFDQLCILDVQDVDNRILIGTPRKLRIEPSDAVRRARAISKEKRLRFDLGELAAHGFSHEEEIQPGSRILMDKATTRPGGS
jgi:spermidine synthase